MRKQGKEVNIMNYSKIKISLASPEVIKGWSSGEVTKPETINYRTFKPERDGLFCAKIFGPTQDFRCLCGKYKGLKYKGIVCEKCGVEVTLSSVRRERMGHIELNSKVAHIWFFKGVPSRIAVLLEITGKQLEHIVYFENYIVIDSGDVPGLKYKQILTEEEYIEMLDKYGEDSFRAGMGAEAVYELLKMLVPAKEVEELKSRLSVEKSIQKKKSQARRLKLMEDFANSGNRPEWMVLSTIPVLPPDLRPLVRLDGGRFASSDLNDLYRRVINRNNRLKRLLDLKAPELIIKNEKRMLQEAVDALFDNQKRNKSYMSSQKRPLKSLSDSLKGKQGRFRQNLLGKRVDYSGRSVIVVDPTLKLDQCGLPKKMALELFKPFIYNKLEKKGMVTTLRVARSWVEDNRDEIWDALDEVIKEHTVLLNRAPTLHRLGIQAFKPHLVEGNSITLHPLVCPAFNADFDGDQMAVHIPLSLEAQAEAKILMLSTNNILNPANGRPLAVPTQDMVLGFYYLTFTKKNLKGENKIFSSQKDVVHALEQGIIDLNARIRVRFTGEFKNLDDYLLDTQDIANCPVIEIVKKDNRLLETTAGRVLFNQLLPGEVPFINGLLKKKGIENLVYYIYLKLGFEATVETLDKLKEGGFEYATRAGFTISISDLVIPPEKEEIIKKTEKELEQVEKAYKEGSLTAGERHNSIIDKWSRATDEIRETMFAKMRKMSYEGDIINPIFVMSDSGARGSKDQLKQLAGMRGLMAKPSGEILETPITANFKEGLSVLQYFISTHGARKGLADTALKTADAGYLTRKLVDAAVEVIVKEEDCGTMSGMEVSAIIEYGKEIEPLIERIIGRTSLDDIYYPDEPERIIVRAGEEIDEFKSKEIVDSGVLKLKIKSALTCETVSGVCRSCYGRNLSTGKLIELGEAVGIIAAQSIGEPGTQLTMRTFHIGGVASGGEGQTKLLCGFDGKLKFKDLETIEDADGTLIAMNRVGLIQVLDLKNREKALYPVIYGSKILAKDGQKVKKGDILIEWDPYINAILTNEKGKVEFRDLEENISYVQDRDEITGKITTIIIDIKNEKLRDELQPQVVLRDLESNKIKRRYYLPVNAYVTVKNGAEVNAGDVLAKIPSEFAKTKDITGGLPRVTELFEARKPKNPAKMAQIDGTVEYGKLLKGSRKLIIHPFDENVPPDEHNIPRGAFIIVGDGDKVTAGTPLMDGPLNPIDILTVLGEHRLAEYLLKEIQDVYRLQGVAINDKHIEIIIRQMIKWRRIEEVGDTKFIPEQIVEKWGFEDENRKVEEAGGRPAKAKPHLLPVSRAALAYDSFISAAAFQETTRVLTEAAIAGKEDHLKGIKENVTMGRLIPAGTGYDFYQKFEIEEQESFFKTAK
ncbi:MAG: DNA-directed RNA polymerase subunit beta' [Candidatus Aminicenantes bacterium]|nr:DNA-directed RNA polymerase subunit beta' [Candidatus Aminicenantes bacterium]